MTESGRPRCADEDQVPGRSDTTYVELIADEGGRAAAPEFFRCPTFLRAEGVSHSLVIATACTRVALPLVVRPIPGGGGYDAISPYGYPGGSHDGPPLALHEVDLTATGLVSIFVRDSVAAPMRGGTERSSVLVHDPARPRSIRSSTAYQVRRNARRGYRVELMPGRQVDDSTAEQFETAYVQTMRRAGATRRYFFSRRYLRACLDSPQSWLVVTWSASGDLAAGTIAVLSDRMLHYFLGGTADAHRGASPAKNGFVGLLDLADEMAIPLNLGGGLECDDGLETFKRGFANTELSFVTHQLICDRVRYAELAAGRRATSFFPAYRAP